MSCQNKIHNKIGKTYNNNNSKRTKKFQKYFFSFLDWINLPSTNELQHKISFKFSLPHISGSWKELHSDASLSIVVREFGSKWLSSQNKQPAPAVVLKHGIDTESASPQGCLEESSPRKKNIFIFKF